MFQKLVLRLIALQILLLLITPLFSLLILSVSFRTYLLEDVRNIQAATATLDISNLSQNAVANFAERTNTQLVFFDNNGTIVGERGSHVITDDRALNEMALAKNQGGWQENSLWSQITGVLVVSTALKNHDGTQIGFVVYAHNPKLIADFCNLLTIVLLLLVAVGATMFFVFVNNVAKKLFSSTNSLNKLAAAYARNQYDYVFERNDISDFAALEEDLALMAQKLVRQIEQLRRYGEQQRNFTANASHELRTPVTAIKLAAETLLDFPELPAETKMRQLAQIYQNTNRLEALTQDLLLLAKSDAAVENFPKQNFDCAALIRACAERAATEHGPRNLTLSAVVLQPLTLFSSPTLCEIIFHNLIDNAYKYSGASSSSVNITAASSPDWLRVVVANSGSTISTNDQAHIFERFYRAEKPLAGKFKGSGIGLALVKQIIDLLGGKISVNCPEAGGVEFVVELPVQ